MIFCSIHRSEPCPVFIREASPAGDVSRCRDPQPGLMKKESILEIFIRSLPSEIMEPCRRWGGNIVGIREWRTPGEHAPNESANQAHMCS